VWTDTYSRRPWLENPRVARPNHTTRPRRLRADAWRLSRPAAKGASPTRLAGSRRGGGKQPSYLRHPSTSSRFAIVPSDSLPLPSGCREDHGGSIMPDPLAGLPPRFLRTPEAARFLGLSGRTLEKHRTYGTGPKYRKIGGRVVYALEDLKAWADLGA